jgi:CheY-like chemotaxis protein
MKRDRLLQLVHEALADFHDLPFLPDHPLITHLATASPLSPAELQTLLHRAIEELKPAPSTPPTCSRWRQYHVLRRRYLDGAPLQQIQQELAIGDRQLRREHQAALRAIAVTLGLDQPEARPVVDLLDVAESPPSSDATLETELGRSHLQSAEELTDLSAAAAGVIPLVEHLAERHLVSITMALSSDLMVGVPRTILRHLLLNLLGYLVSVYPGSQIRVLARHTDAEVELLLQIDPRRVCESPAVNDGDDPAECQQRLATACRLAERHGGRLLIDANAGDSIRAHLTLPAVRVATVLCIDDNPDVEHLFRRYLQGTGFQVVQARNGAGAFEIIRRVQPVVIVLDLMLPVEDGWEIFQRLKQNPATCHLPVIACSILPERELALSLGVDGFLAKPVTRPSLLATLKPYQVGSPATRPGSLANT